jgi:hypothetical protein
VPNGRQLCLRANKCYSAGHGLLRHINSKRYGSDKMNMISKRAHYLWPVGAGLAGAVFLTTVYFVIVSLAESPKHAVELFWEDRFIVTPIILGFGIQAALYTILKKRLFVPVNSTGPSGPLMGAGGTTSTVAMVACCAHHVADLLPVLGLTAAAAFLAQYRTAFMLIGLGTTVLGIAIMLVILVKERRRVIHQMKPTLEML